MINIGGDGGDNDYVPGDDADGDCDGGDNGLMSPSPETSEVSIEELFGVEALSLAFRT